MKQMWDVLVKLVPPEKRHKGEAAVELWREAYLRDESPRGGE